MFHQPNIDPVIFRIWGPLQVRWYSLLYISGFFVARWILRKLSREERFRYTDEDVEQWILWALVGVVAGARIVYCVVYDPKSLMANPLYLFEVYRGGLSFHGGLIGAAAATWLFARRKGLSVLNLLDAAAIAAPLGLFLGRIGNFMNGELWGRPTDMPWGVVFRNAGPDPRHPSQLYEGFLEGLLLFAALWVLRNRLPRNGQIGLVFLVGYSLARFFVEFFREPDAHIGYLVAGLTMGQILSLVQILVGAVVFVLLTPAKGKNSAAR
jgi:phosphatidylglycerol:prolipoprotein diacylglycerol transferase